MAYGVLGAAGPPAVLLVGEETRKGTDCATVQHLHMVETTALAPSLIANLVEHKVVH